MKKLFTFVAVLLFTASINAAEIFSETFDKNGTYVDKVQSSSNWPYADQWFTGYTGKGGEVTGSQYVEDYTDVKSHNVSIRNKKVDAADPAIPGLFFGASKVDSVVFYGIGLESAIATTLKVTFCNPESTDKLNANNLEVLINDVAYTVPSVEVSQQLVSAVFSIDLPAMTIDKIRINMNNKAKAIFVTKIAIEAPTAVDNVFENVKATKMVENGQIVIIRNGVKYNTVGAVVE